MVQMTVPQEAKVRELMNISLDLHTRTEAFITLSFGADLELW